MLVAFKSDTNMSFVVTMKYKVEAGKLTFGKDKKY